MKYSNGYGHLIVTVVALICITVLVESGKADISAFLGIGGPIIAFWFMSGMANRFNTLNPSAPPPTHGTIPPDPESTQPLPIVKKP